MIIYKDTTGFLSSGDSLSGSFAIPPGFSEVPAEVLALKYAEFDRNFRISKLYRYAQKRKFYSKLDNLLTHSFAYVATEQEKIAIAGCQLHEIEKAGERELHFSEAIYLARQGDVLIHFLTAIGQTGINYLVLGKQIIAEVDSEARITWKIDSNKLILLAKQYPQKIRLRGHFPLVAEEPKFTSEVEDD